MKYAMFESGGKQYIARQGETVEVDHLPLNVGVKAEFKTILLVSDGSTVKIGTPFVEGASVSAKVVGQVRAPKVIVFKYIPKERYRRKKGHRQQYTRVEIQDVLFPGEEPTKAERIEEAPVGAVAEKEPAVRKPASKSKTAKKTSVKKAKSTSKSTTKKSTGKKTASKKSVEKE